MTKKQLNIVYMISSIKLFVQNIEQLSILVLIRLKAEKVYILILNFPLCQKMSTFSH